jgi:ABC-2 type transport system permease protein
MLLALIRKETLALLRDAHGLAAMFLMPVVFIIVMSLALQNVYKPAQVTLSYVMVVRDAGTIGAAFARKWQETHGAPQALASDWEQRLRRGQLDYAVRIEPGFSGELHALGLPARAQLTLLTEPGMDGRLSDSLRDQLLSLAGEFKARAALQAAGMPPPVGASFSTLVRTEQAGAMVGDSSGESAMPHPNATQHNVAAWLVFGMFFIVSSMSGLFLHERAAGTLARLRSLGAGAGVLLLSKALPYVGVNAVQAVLMGVVGIAVLPWLGGQALSLAGVHVGALLAVLLAISIASVSLALALACAVRTAAQAATVGPVLNVLMGALGGIMVPTFVMPAVMQRVAAFSPMNWGLRALLAVLLRGAGVVQVLPQMGWLLAFAALMLVLAAWLFRRD